MSNNLIRKGLAIGTALAISLTGLAAAPASADTAGLVTLSPSAGTTFNSLKKSGITLKSTVDSDLTQGTLSFLVSNPSKAALVIGSVTGGTGTAESIDVSDVVNGVISATPDAQAGDSGSATATRSTSLFVVSYSTDASVDSTEFLKITSTKATLDVQFSVTAWLDKDSDGIIDPVETTWASKAETVNLYDPANVTAKATIDNTAFQIGTASVSVDVALDKDINVSQIANSTYAVALYKNGAAIDITSPTVSSGDTVDSIVADAKVANYDSTRKTIAVDLNPDTPLTNFDAGNYQVRAALIGATAATYEWAGPSSATIALAVGGDQDVAAIAVSAKDAVNVVFTKDEALSGAPAYGSDDNTLVVRSGAKTVTYVAQALKADASSANAATDTNDSYDALESASVRVKAVVTAKVLADGSTITVAGSTTTLSAAGKSAIVYGTTNASGQFSVAVTDTGAATADKYSVAFYYLDTNGAWVDRGVAVTSESGKAFGSSVATATYAAAAVPSGGFDTVQANRNFSGENVTITFNVKDQFGQLLSEDANGKFSVYLRDSQSTTTFKSTVAVSGGKAAFTFKNYLAKGSTATLYAYLFNGTTYASENVTNGSITNISLFNVEATGAITATSSVSNEVSYQDFFSGDTAADSTLTALTVSDATDATITGRVEDINGAAQAGAEVTVSGAGLQFKNGTVNGTDKLTFNAAADGTFSVVVWSHVANSTGAKITFTSGGKTATTTLKTYLPSSVDVADNLAFSVKLPAFMVKNTTYTVTAKLTDKWNNPIKTATNGSTYGVTFLGTGSVTVNGKDTDVNKNFDKNGSVTVYVRSVKDVAGPGSLTATLGAASYTATSGATSDVLPIAQQTTDDTATKWDETAFVNEISTDVELLDKNPAASITKAATSTVVVKNANGTTLKVVRGTVSKTVVADANSEKITLKGGKGAVKVYVNGKLIASK